MLKVTGYKKVFEVSYAESNTKINDVFVNYERCLLERQLPVNAFQSDKTLEILK